MRNLLIQEGWGGGIHNIRVPNNMEYVIIKKRKVKDDK